jgi:hypothetical protein
MPKVVGLVEMLDAAAADGSSTIRIRRNGVGGSSLRERQKNVPCCKTTAAAYTVRCSENLHRFFGFFRFSTFSPVLILLYVQLYTVRSTHVVGAVPNPYHGES